MEEKKLPFAMGRPPAPKFHGFEFPRARAPVAHCPSTTRNTWFSMVKYGKKMKKPAAPLMPLHKYSLEYEKSKQQANEKRLQLLDEATAYCIENGAQPKDAVKLKRFESLTKDQIRYHMNRNARSERDILTKTERDRIFEWMNARADDGTEPVTEKMLGEEIVKILKARLADNRAKNIPIHTFSTSGNNPVSWG